MKNRQPESPYWKWLPASFALAGIIVFIFATYGPPASSSGFVCMVKGLIEPFAPAYVESKAHYAMLPDTGSWLFAFVVGMAAGGFLAGRTFPVPVKEMPETWLQRFGKSRTKRFAAAFAGGFMILFAARLAGGCTLGLFISGSTQLALSGLYFGVLIFGSAMLTAYLIHVKTGKEKK